jgi:hypothetical protein
MNEDPPLRIGDTEREEAVRRLGEHYEAGRLSAEEHSERVDQALRAKTETELASLFTDLPNGRSGAASGAPWSGAPWSTGTGASDASWSGASRSSGPGGPAGKPFGPRPDWAAGGFIRRMPFPLLVALGVLGVLLSVACVVVAGHPPVLPILLAVAAVLVIRKRRHA